MSLLKIYKQNPENILDFSVERLVVLAGEGKLKDGSKCSQEFREFLQFVNLQKIAKYVEEVLTKKIVDGGFVLQDLVNEVGRRLGFDVTNGRYHGIVNQSGHDGLWVCDNFALVIEVKTTDAYRINLTTLAAYSNNVRKENDFADKDFGILLIVGRQDTGDLEAQIRGSKFAWDIRLVSIESLIELGLLFEVALDNKTLDALRGSLLPIEFTRLDPLVKLLSRIATDAERTAVAEEDVGEYSQLHVQAGPEEISTVDYVKMQLVGCLESKVGSKLDSISKSIFEDKTEGKYIISVSKRYARTDQQYWYAYQMKWLEMLKSSNSYLVLGMLDKKYFYLIPGSDAIKYPDALNKTVKNSNTYWHIALKETDDGISLMLPKIGKQINLDQYKVTL